MAHALAPVSEAEAEGKIKDAYEDLKATLRIPYVPLAFQVLATHPDFLQVAWRGLKPNAQTVFFHQQADQARRTAVDSVPDIRSTTLKSSGDALDVARALLYSNAPVLLAVSALRIASTGQQPRLTELPAEAKRQITSGLPQGMPDLQAREQVAGPVAEIAASWGPGPVDSSFYVLDRYADTVTQAWSAWRPFQDSAEHRRALRALGGTIEGAVTALPFRINVYPHALRHAGISESAIDDIRATLGQNYEGLRRQLLFLAYLARALGGRDAAVDTRFGEAQSQQT